jgi:hypothetical protein
MRIYLTAGITWVSLKNCLPSNCSFTWPNEKKSPGPTSGESRLPEASGRTPIPRSFEWTFRHGGFRIVAASWLLLAFSDDTPHGKTICVKNCELSFLPMGKELNWSKREILWNKRSNVLCQRSDTFWIWWVIISLSCAQVPREWWSQWIHDSSPVIPYFRHLGPRLVITSSMSWESLSLSAFCCSDSRSDISFGAKKGRPRSRNTRRAVVFDEHQTLLISQEDPWSCFSRNRRIGLPKSVLRSPPGFASSLRVFQTGRNLTARFSIVLIRNQSSW